ncbi:LOW QUALITY PROTEIN: ADP-ribosylhydrolase ARH1-like [Pelecanus crispus]|uniref:LOW QUALITY PROTEIN: ADP-ribosylhydrolase ARH1-like n=1 Tax=Pelecanus crispus TaxID=36300 RepID=UPI003F5D0ADC
MPRTWWVSPAATTIKEIPAVSPRVPSVEAYEEAMVLSRVGDALGYRGGLWEYCTSGPQIHAELAELGGLEAITLEPPEWPVSDDTVLHLVTAEGLATGLEGEPLLQELACRYVAAMGDMEGRKPGPTSMLGTSQLQPGEPEGYCIPFNPTGTGCGAAMRSLAIGLRYPHAWELPMLLRVSIESGHMAHHHPTGYLGTLAVARFGGSGGGLAERWGAELLRVLPLAWDYVEGAGVTVGDNTAAWPFFRDTWHWYLESWGLLEGHGPPRVPSLLSPAEQDAAHLGWVLEGWPGCSGHDVTMVALEALLAASRCWEDLCTRAVLRGGDSDSTGTIAAGCWVLGAAGEGLASVPPGLHCCLEHRGQLCDAAHRLHALAWGRC